MGRWCLVIKMFYGLGAESYRETFEYKAYLKVPKIHACFLVWHALLVVLFQ